MQKLEDIVNLVTKRLNSAIDSTVLSYISIRNTSINCLSGVINLMIDSVVYEFKMGKEAFKKESWGNAYTNIQEIGRLSVKRTFNATPYDLQLSRKEQMRYFEDELRDKAGLNMELYDKFLNIHNLGEQISMTLTKCERRVRDYEYDLKIVVAGYVAGNLPREIQEIFGAALGIREKDIYKLSMWQNLPSPAEVGFYSAALTYASNGDAMPLAIKSYVIANLVNKPIMLAAPLITKKAKIHPLSFLNPVYTTLVSMWYLKRALDKESDSNHAYLQPVTTAIQSLCPTEFSLYD